MKAICYYNTLTNLPFWNPHEEVHLTQPLGFAYEDVGHFIHLYGWDVGFKGISIGLAVGEGKENEHTIGKTLEQWVQESFGATDITYSLHDIGNSVRGVWRPGLYYNSDTLQAIGAVEHERFLSEQAIKVLIQKLDEIFFFVEPNISTKETFSHKIRELLILTCTEIENFWKTYLLECGLTPLKGGFTTRDYIKLKSKLYLDTFEFSLISYPELGSIRPFEHWDLTNPTQSLFWYDAYNKTKHDRTNHFSKATLWNAINSIVGCLILHCVRFGPYSMFENDSFFSSIIKQHFTGRIVGDCKETFYIPKVEMRKDIGTHRFVFDPMRENLTRRFIVQDLIL